jgi:hypothetical protein
MLRGHLHARVFPRSFFTFYSNGRKVSLYQYGIRLGSPVKELPVGVNAEEECRILIEWCRSSNEYARVQKKRFRMSATITWALSLGLSAGSTIILGLQTLSFWASVGFILVALVTLVNGFEPYFNWRSRWVLSEEAQHHFYRLEEDIAQHLASTPSDHLNHLGVMPFYQRYSDAWNEYSKRWTESRRQANQP